MCRLDNDKLQRRKRKKDIARGLPVERTQGEIIILPLTDGKLFYKIVKRIETMRSIEFLVVFSVTAFYFAVMSGCERSDLLMLDTKLFKRFLEECRQLFPAAPHLVCKLKSVICLNAFYGVRELLHYVFQENGGGICVFFLESLQITKTAVFINKGVLVVVTATLLSILCCFSNKAHRRNVFHIDLNLLTGIPHLFIRLWNILRVRQLDRSTADPAQQLIQPGDRSGVAASAKFDPEYYQAVVWVPPAHILYQRDLSLCVLIWVTVRTVGAVCQRVYVSVVFLLPTIDILPTGLVADSGFRNAVLHRILNYCLLIPHVLCYLIHSE